MTAKVRGIKLKRNTKLRTNQKTTWNKSETQGTHERARGTNTGTCADRKQTNQQRMREQQQLNKRVDEVQVERHWEQRCANEADVSQMWGENQTGKEHQEHRREPTLGTQEGTNTGNTGGNQHREHRREPTLGTQEGTNTGNTGGNQHWEHRREKTLGTRERKKSGNTGGKNIGNTWGTQHREHRREPTLGTQVSR